MTRTNLGRATACAVLILACIFASVPTSQAAIVRLDFTGSVSQIDSDALGVFTMGDPITGSVFIDTSTPDAYPDIPTWAFHRNAVVSGWVSVIGQTSHVPSILLPTSLAGVHVNNDDPLYGDAYGVTTGLEGANVGGLSPEYFRILSIPMNPGPEVWDGVAMPTTTPEIEVFAGFEWWLDLSPQLVDVRGVISDISLTPVPLPAAWTLLSGALVLLRLRARNRP